MINRVLKVFRKEYRTLNKIELSKDHLLANHEYLSALNKGIKVAPVIKSNAYGHGAVLVARILDSVGASFFCVDSLYEAYELMNAGIKTTILIMGYTDPHNFKVKKLPFSYALFDLDSAKVLNKYQTGCGVHIFVDTGMHREGIPLSQLPEFLKELKKLNNVRVDGLMSHLASSDDTTDPLNKIQTGNFKKALEICKEHNIYPKWTHLSNSSGLLNNIAANLQNLSRIGLAIYGLSNDKRISKDKNLKPILTFKSRIIQIKNLNKGDRVGYNGTFAAKSPTVLGILPLGHYDGVDRRLSNKGWVAVDGKLCKILGRVSMNITTVDLTDVTSPHVGQEAIVYSNNPNDKNSVENVARLCKTIPYVMLIHLAASIKRVII